MASLSCAQFLSNPYRIYTNQVGITVKKFGAAATTCSVTLVIMDDTTQCIKYLDGDGNVYDTDCSATTASATNMLIYGSAGYVTSPINGGRFVILDMYSGDEIANVPQSAVGVFTDPYKMTLFSGFSSHTLGHNWHIADGATNTTIVVPSWTITHPGNVFSYGYRIVTTLKNASPIKCFFAPGAGVNNVMFSYESDPTTIINWDTTTAAKYTYNISGFTQIEACAADFYNRLYIWDSGCTCLKVFTQAGASLYNLTLPDVVGIPLGIYPTRNRVYIHDQNGVMRYNFPALSVTFIPPTQPTCTSGSSAGFLITGGTPPYFPRVVPDQSFGSTADKNFNVSTSFGGLGYRAPFNYVMSLYDDVIAPEWEVASPTVGAVWNTSVPSSEVPTRSGTGNSWRMLMSNRYQYRLQANSVISGARIMANYYSSLEMYVNVAGAGKWSLDLTGLTQPPTNWYYFNYNETDFQPGVWTKISVDLSRNPIGAQLLRLSFFDYSNSSSTTNFIYVDDIRLIPYNTTDRYMMVADFCNVTFVSAPITITASNVLAVNVSAQGVSCNAVGAVGNQSADGELHAVSSGGVAPVFFTWSLNGVTSNATADLTNLGVMEDKNILIYDNTIGPLIADRSSGNVNLADTAYFFVGNASASLVPGSATDSLFFYYSAGFTVAKYPYVDFYVNGGPQGGQLINAGFINAQTVPSNLAMIHRTLGLPAIPANTWIKVRMAVPTGTFYGFVIQGITGVTQTNRAYFDSIVLVNNEQSASVTDSAGCKITNFNVGVPAPKPLLVVPSVTNMACYNSVSGAISFSVSGGSGPYTYNWTGLASFNGSSNSNLTDSVYTIKVSDNNGCASATPVNTIEVLRPPALNLVYTSRPAACYGLKGSIVANAVGGIEPYYFSWTSTASLFTGPSPQSSPAPIFSDSVASGFSLDSRTNSSVACYGANLRQNGTLSSQSGLCSILVRPGIAATSLFGVGCTSCIDLTQNSGLKFWIHLLDPATNYKLVAQFTKNDLPIITQPLNLTSSSGWQSVYIRFPAGITDPVDSFTLVNGAGGNTGAFMLDSIVLLPVGTISPGSGVRSGFDALAEGHVGTYTVSVTDANSCPVTAQWEITQPTQIDVYVTPAEPSSEGGDDGSATASVTGGTPPYTYFWSQTGARTQTATGLKGGAYTVTVTDANGCLLTSSVTIPSGVGKSIRPYTPAVATGFGVIIGIGVIMAFLSIVILAFRWDRFSTYGPFYCAIINFGVIVAYIAGAVVLPEATDGLCLAFPWLLGIAFNLVYGCLFIKTWVLYRVFRKATQMKKTNLTPFYILRVLSMFVGIEVVFMLIWTFVDPPKAGYADLLDNRKEWQCTNSKNSNVFWVVFLAIKGAWLVFGAILAFMTRNIVKEYNESKSIAYAIYNDIVLIIIAIPLALTLKEVPRGVVVVETAIIFISFTFTLLLLFFPIWWSIFFSSVDLQGITIKKASGGSTSSTGHSPTNSNATSSSSREVYSL